MSIQRQMIRAMQKKGAPKPKRAQPWRESKDKAGIVTGYKALHPTKGWKTISYKRLAGQHAMAGVLA